MSKASLCLMAIFLALCSAALAQFTILNGSFDGDLYGWDGVLVEGRENGPYMGSVAYQTINSPNDPVSGSGSILFTGSGNLCSLSQQLGILAQGQTLTIYADIARDDNWDYLIFGFYDENAPGGGWNICPDASVDVVPLVPADTDGTLDSFVRIEATGPVTNTDGNLRVFIGSSCDPYTSTQSGQFAIDYVSTEFAPPTPTPTATPPSSASFWCLYE